MLTSKGASCSVSQTAHLPKIKHFLLALTHMAVQGTYSYITKLL